MRRQCRPKVFVAILVLTVLNMLCYLSIYPIWSAIARYTCEPIPYVLLALLFVFILVLVVFLVLRKMPFWLAVIGWLQTLFFLLFNCIVVCVTMDVCCYYLRNFLSLIFVLGGLASAFVLGHLARKKWGAVILVSACFVGVFSWTLFLYRGNGILYDPVVYAVGREYQIVFQTRVHGTGWIEINGQEYSDTNAGYQTCGTRIHKIKVPMEELDGAKEYEIHARSMVLRGPYGLFQGKKVRKTYSWRGVKEEDGLQYYVFADTHNTSKSPYQAATYFGDDLDFLIFVGDSVSWIETEKDLNEVLRLTGKITKGQVPVIYARGNHETKGTRAQEYHQYVGADEENYYYTFRLKNIWGIVLDIGENHGDQYEEYEGTAKFQEYREAQTKFLDKVLKNADKEFDAKGVDYRIAVCHIPLTVKYVDDHAGKIKDAWLERLNQMKLTILYSGHVHELWYIKEDFQKGSMLTQCEDYSGKCEGNSSRIMGDSTFPSILVSRRSAGQLLTFKEKVFDTNFIGTAATSDGEKTVLQYTNEKQENLKNIVCPWFSEVEYGDKIVIDNVK